uniref:Uncharacterized protein n=1 Tax=Micrurus corallinus TaxID=54390 RepID=A0A2D4F747_MICCO
MPRPSRIPIRRRPVGQTQHLLRFHSCSDDSSLKVWKYAAPEIPAQSSLPEFQLEMPVMSQREESLFLCPPKVLLDEVWGGGSSAKPAAAATLTCSRCHPLEPLSCRQKKKKQRLYRCIGSSHPPY